MFFEDDVTQMTAILSAITPTKESVRMVAAAFKGEGSKYEAPYYEWARAFGRYKAKVVWRNAVPDPDALEAVIEEQFAAQVRRDRFVLHSPNDLPAYDASYRVKGVFPVSGVAVIYGPSGSGKSFVALEMATAIAEGGSFLGLRTARSDVLYIVLEGELGFINRVRAWEVGSQKPLPQSIRILLQAFRLTDPSDVADLAALCWPGCVVIVDTLNRAAPGIDENSSKDIGIVIDAAKTLQTKVQGLVVLIAHSGKDATKGLRGHSSLYAATDGVIAVSREGDNRRLKIEKSKDGEDGKEFGFRLRVIGLGFDSDGDAITSCVVEQTDLPTNGRSVRPMSPNHRTALEAFKSAALTSGNNTPDGTVEVELEAFRREFYRLSPSDNEETKRKAFQRARADLIGRGLLAVASDMYRLAGSEAEAFSKFALARRRSPDTGTGQGQLLDLSRVETPP